MANNDRLQRIEISPAENGFQVSIVMKPKKDEDNGMSFGDEKKEVYGDVNGVLGCVKQHLHAAAKNLRVDSILDSSPDDDYDEDED